MLQPLKRGCHVNNTKVETPLHASTLQQLESATRWHWHSLRAGQSCQNIAHRILSISVHCRLSLNFSQLTLQSCYLLTTSAPLPSLHSATTSTQLDTRLDIRPPPAFRRADAFRVSRTPLKTHHRHCRHHHLRLASNLAPGLRDSQTIPHHLRSNTSTITSSHHEPSPRAISPGPLGAD